MLGPDFVSHGTPNSFASGAFGVIQILENDQSAGMAKFQAVTPGISLSMGALIYPTWMGEHIHVGHALSFFEAKVDFDDELCWIDGTRPEATLIPHPRSHGRMAEGFGGIGGWAFGTRVLGQTPIFAVELDEETALAYGKTHVIPVFGVIEALQKIRENTIPDHFVIHGDMQDVRVWQIAGILDVDSWVVSPPCPPWCSSGFQKGLNCVEGQILVGTIQRASACGVNLMMMENVPNIVKHQDYAAVKQLAAKAGLALICSQIDDCFPILPCTRKRWMAIFHSSSSQITNHCLLQANAVKWPTVGNPRNKPEYSLQVADCLFDKCTVEQLGELIPNDELWELMKDPKFLAPWEKGHNGSPENAIQVRTVPPDGIFKSIMASYGSQDKIPQELLLKSGLHSFLIADCDAPNDVRLASPWELLASLGFDPACYLPKTIEKAWRIVGNVITPAHAVVCCIRVAYLLPKSSPFAQSSRDMRQLAQLIRDGSIKQSLWKEVTSDSWRWLETAVGHLFELDHNISPTIPYQLDEGVLGPMSNRISIIATGHADKEREEEIRKHLMQVDAPQQLMGLIPWVVIHGDGLVCHGGWTQPQQSVEKLLKLVWPHLVIGDVDSISLNDNPASWIERCKGSYAHVQVVLSKTEMVVHCETNTKSYCLQIDAAWTAIDVKGYVGCNVGCLPKQLSLTPGGFDVEDDEFVALGFSNECVVRQAISMSEEVKCLRPRQVAVPPRHSDGCIPVGQGFVRFATRHPLWSTVRTAAAIMEHTVDQLLAVLLPDFPKGSVGLQDNGNDILCEQKVKDLPMGELFIVFFQRDLPMQQLFRRVPMTSFTLQEAITMKQRWVKSPFNNRAQVIDVPDVWTLCELAASFFVPTNSMQTLLCIVNGVTNDPRTQLKDVDQQHVITIRACALPGGAKKNELKTLLRRLLVSHGVPESAVNERIESIISNIGIERLRQHESEDDEQLWGSMKSLASEKHIRLITATELRNFQKLKRANSKVGVAAGPSKPKGGEKAPFKLPPLDELVFSAKHFVAEEDEVQIIPAARFGPDAKGITIMSISEAAKHVTAGCISLDPLAILAVGQNAETLGQKIMVPAHSKAGDPLLIPCVLLQHGEMQIEFCAATPAANTDTIDTITLEFTIKRSMTSQWEATSTPLHFLGVQCPELRGAGRVLSTWSIKTYRDRKPVAFAEAQHWHGYIRLDAVGIESVLKRSGQNGIFFTPRGADRKPDPRFAVIAMPGQGVDGIKETLANISDGLGIAVLGSNFMDFGIRCRRENQDAIRQQLFPETLRVDAASVEDDDQLYFIRHLAAQFSRDSMDVALKEVKWEAKAIRPIGADAWLVASTEKPPAGHLCINGSLAVVTPKRDSRTPVVLTRTQTMTRVDGAQDGTISVTKHSRVDEMKADLHLQLETLVDAKMKDANQKLTQLTTALEETRNQLQVCQEQNQKEIEQVRVSQAQTSQKVGDLEGALQNNASSIITQMRDMLNGFHQDNTQQVQGLQKSFSNQFQDFQQDMSNRIEAIEREQNKKLKTGPSPKKNGS